MSLSERPESTGVSKVFPGKRRLKLSRGETQYFRWTQFGIQSVKVDGASEQVDVGRLKRKGRAGGWQPEPSMRGSGRGRALIATLGK